jgi:hypothetical protein
MSRFIVASARALAAAVPALGRIPVERQWVF